MLTKKFSFGSTVVLFALTGTFLMTCTYANAQTEKVLLNLTLDGGVGGDPQAGLISDAAGNLYGTTGAGGPRSGGTVFELSRRKGGGWVSEVLHAFISGINDGQRPQAGVIFDAAGNLYGTTYWGGAYGDGTVFELIAQPHGGWKEKPLHSFGANATDGKTPQAGVVFDSAGNLYGTAFSGGAYDAGTLYELMPQADGSWKEKIVLNFGSGVAGDFVLAGLVLDGGNLYGATSAGGLYDAGTVFELTPAGGGNWNYSTIYNFNESGDGNYPYGTPILDAQGNLYGTTTQGGLYGWGTAYELSPQAGGQWAETVLHNFNYDGVDGINPYSALVLDASGNLYGTADQGGSYNNGGIAFELMPAAGGAWTEVILHNFGSTDTDGTYPLGNLHFDSHGNLYGTTDVGGSAGNGTVFEIVP